MNEEKVSHEIEEEVAVENVMLEEQKKFMEEMQKLHRLQNQQQFSRATPPHSLKMRGVGITRKNKSETKAAKKAASKQRAVNRKRASKKSRPTGSKQRK